MVVKVRDGQVMNKPVYVVIGVTVNGERDILGLWAGDGGEGAKFWLSVFTEINAVWRVRRAPLCLNAPASMKHTSDEGHWWADLLLRPGAAFSFVV